MQMNLSPFLDKNLFEAGTSFFNQLKVPLNSNTTISLHLKDILKDKFKSQEIVAGRFQHLTKKWKYSDHIRSDLPAHDAAR